MKENDPLTLTVVETAALLRISRNTAYALISQGRIPSIRLGKRVLIPRKALDTLLDVQQPPPVSEADPHKAS
jgi:excisionase family DNA binding protein